MFCFVLKKKIDSYTNPYLGTLQLYVIDGAINATELVLSRKINHFKMNLIGAIFDIPDAPAIKIHGKIVNHNNTRKMCIIERDTSDLK